MFGRMQKHRYALPAVNVIGSSSIAACWKPQVGQSVVSSFQTVAPNSMLLVVVFGQ